MEGEEIQPGSPQASLPRRRPVQPPTPEVAAGRWWSALPTGRFMRVPAPVTAPVPAPPAPAAVPAPPVAAARGGRTTAGGGQRPIMRRTLAAALLAVLLLGILVGRLSTHTQAPAATTQAPTPAKTPAPARTSGTIAQQGKRAMEAAGRYMADSAKKIRSAVKETKENGPEQVAAVWLLLHRLPSRCKEEEVTETVTSLFPVTIHADLASHTYNIGDVTDLVLEAECPNAFLAAWRPEWRPCNLVLWSKLGRRLGFLLGEQYPELVRKLILAKAEQVSVRASMATPLTSDCGGGGDTVGLQVTFTGSASAVHQVRLHLFAHAPDITQLITQRQDSLVLHTIPAICMQHTRLHTCIAGAPSKPFGPLLPILPSTTTPAAVAGWREQRPGPCSSLRFVPTSILWQTQRDDWVCQLVRPHDIDITPLLASSCGVQVSAFTTTPIPAAQPGRPTCHTIVLRVVEHGASPSFYKTLERLRDDGYVLQRP